MDRNQEREDGAPHPLRAEKVAPGAVPKKNLLVAPSPHGGKHVTYEHRPSLQQQQVKESPKLEEEDLEEFSKMFPEIEKSVIEAVFVESGGSKEATVNALWNWAPPETSKLLNNSRLHHQTILYAPSILVSHVMATEN